MGACCQLESISLKWTVIFHTVEQYTESSKHDGVTGISQLYKRVACQLRLEPFVSSLGQLLRVRACLWDWMHACLCVYIQGSGGNEAVSRQHYTLRSFTKEDLFSKTFSRKTHTSSFPALLVVWANQCSHWAPHTCLHVCTSVCVCIRVNPPPSSGVLVSTFRDQRFLRALIQQTPPLPRNQTKPNTPENTNTGVCVCVHEMGGAEVWRGGQKWTNGH